MESRLSVLVVVIAVVVIELFVAVASDPVKEPSGLGVCTSLKVDTKRSTVTEYKIQTNNVSYFCLRNFHFKCYYQTETITPVNVEKVLEVYKTVSKCCDGYSLSENGLNCNPVCEKPCIWGKCILPNMCLCDKFYEGPTCEEHTVCPVGKFGPECKQRCRCQNNGSCNPFDGSCRCQEGFIGNYCESQCWPGYYGDNCRYKCNCPANNTCDPVSGICTISRRYIPPICPSGFFGPNCENKCACQNEAICNSENGNCICQPGYIGSECESECPPGYYGYNCLGKCNCKNDTLCDAQTGYCMCDLDEPGIDCGVTSPRDLYRVDCSTTQSCQNGGKCREPDGICECPPGYYGLTCSEACPPNLYGDMCSKVCECDIAECDRAKGCILNHTESHNVSDTSLWSAEEIKARRKFSNNNDRISNISVILTLFCTAGLLITIFVLKFFHFNTSCQTSNEENANNSKLRHPLDVQVNSAISAISSGKYLKSGMIDSKNMNTPSSMDGFHESYSFSHDNYGYDTTENFYLEIDEGIVENTDVYDHLDFLRPAKSWKPHYQRPAVMQDQKTGGGGGGGGSNDNSRRISFNVNSSRVQQQQH